jgi:hypothetical protein
MIKDIDILCLATHLGQEELKRQLVAYNSNFYVVPSRDPNATYKVLWYRFPSTGSSVKVDILLPGVMDIPNIATSRIDYGASGGRELPVAPLSLVFLLKLQAWSQHRASSISRFYQKQYTDHSDITHLLPVLAMKGIKPNEESYLPTSFRDEAVRRVREYTRQYPESISNWRNIGYDVAPLPSVVRSTVVRRVYNGTPTRISLSSRVESWLDAYD